MIVSNATPLIYLAKTKKINLLKKLFEEITIPKEVYDEVVKEKKEIYRDALLVDKAVKEGWIKVKNPKAKRKKNLESEIDKGEISVINLAEENNAELVLIDDASARTIAESFGLNVKGTLYVILRSLERKIISKKEAKSSIEEIIKAGFRISTELYIKITEEIDKK